MNRQAGLLRTVFQSPRPSMFPVENNCRLPGQNPVKVQKVQDSSGSSEHEGQRIAEDFGKGRSVGRRRPVVFEKGEGHATIGPPVEIPQQTGGNIQRQ